MAELASQPEGSKKRKRTGKQREEAKKAAIQAKLEAEQGVVKTEADDAAEGDPPIEPAAEETIAAEAQPVEVDYEKIAGRIPQALKTLHPVFKQAKTFEVRRLLKKIKFLRAKDTAKDELADLEAQFTLLSHIPLHSVAQSHLLVKLAKHPKLKASPLPISITSLLAPADAPSSSGSEQVRAKVENRLCSSKAVADSVKSTLSWIVGEEGAKLGRPVKGKAETPKKPSKKAAIDVDESDAEGDDELIVPPRRQVAAESDDDLGIEDEAADEAGWESGSVDEGDMQLAPASSDDESGSEGDGESDSSSSSVAVPAKRAKAAPQPSAKALKEAKAQAAKAVTSSTFLPSLSTGFTLGDSDSDPDLDPDVDGKGIVGRKGAVERKNRRGQRARQAIWEKKYGKGAKHVVKAREAEEVKEREKKWGRSDTGWGGKTGQSGDLGNGGRAGQVGGAARGGAAAASRGGRGGAVGRGGFAGGRGGLTGGSAPAAPALASGPKAAAGGAQLHPSWEAARLRKQKEEAVANAPKATKITFD